jgi:hypothetical protein
MALTAKSRAGTALRASTQLTPVEALAVVKEATKQVKEGGIGMKGGRIAKTDLQVLVKQEHADGLALMMGSDISKRGLATFSATAGTRDGETELQVGGLATYKILQSKLLGLIPFGPSSIVGFSFYKRFLDEVAAQLEAHDPTAAIAVEVPIS